MFVDFYANLSVVDDPRISPPLVTRLANGTSSNIEVVVFLAVIVATVGNVLIVRTVLRAVRTPLPESTGGAPPAERERERFRTFLLLALKRFLANEWDRSQTRKRGGGVSLVSLNGVDPMAMADRKALSAESLYERRWALTLLESVMQRLRDEHESAGRLADYERLKPCLTAERGGIDYESLAAAMRIQPASARSAVHRLRKRFRELFRDEVDSTVADPADVDDEMRAVIAALGSA